MQQSSPPTGNITVISFQSGQMPTVTVSALWREGEGEDVLPGQGETNLIVAQAFLTNENTDSLV